MKITDVRITLFRDDLEPGSGAPSAAAGRNLCLVEVVTGSALCGLAVTTAHAAPAIRSLGGALLGEDPRSAMGLWERMGAAIPAGSGLSAAQARAALDIAMWDLKSRANDEPLWKTLGGAHPHANAHLHHETRTTDREVLVDWYRSLSAATGIRSASLPASADPAADLATLQRLRSVLGADQPETALMVHFDGTLLPTEAVLHGRVLESGVDLTWVRSPVRPGDFRGARLVADKLAAAVCMGAGLGDVSAFLPFLEHYAANVLELDLATLGVSGIVQMVDAAFGFELPVALTASHGHVPVQLFSALPNAASVAIDSLTGGGRVISGSVSWAKGRAIAGTGPGNGIVVDRAALERARARAEAAG